MAILPPDLTSFTPTGPVGDGKLYIERPADHELPELLAQGEFCCVFAPRQIGKTSLHLHAARQLAQRGIRCAHIDLTGIGTVAVSLEKWCYTFATIIARELGLQGWEDRWGSETGLTAIARWIRFLRVEVLDSLTEPVVLFVDEIDVMLQHEFRDDIFAAIRALYHDRGREPAYKRLTFCLIGVAMPQDLASNPTRTPFNIGCQIALRDFTDKEARAFAAGFPDSAVSEQLIAAVLHWTSGHPAMTQQLCAQLAAQPPQIPSDPQARVQELVTELYLSKRLDPIINDTAQRFIHHHAGKDTRPLLLLYYRLLSNERVNLDVQNELHHRLQLIGMASARTSSDGTVHLVVRNRILAAVLNKDWAEARIESHKLTEHWFLWQKSDYKEAHLLRGPELARLRKWAAEQSILSTEERKILQVSEEKEQSLIRAQREVLRRLLLAAGLVICIILIAFLGIHSISRQESRELRKRVFAQEEKIRNLENTLRDINRLTAGADQDPNLDLTLLCSTDPAARDRTLAAHIKEVRQRQKALAQLSQQVEKISGVLSDSLSRTARAKSKLDSGMMTLLLGELKEARSEINELDQQLKNASKTSEFVRDQLEQLTPRTAAVKPPTPPPSTPAFTPTLDVETAPDRFSQGVDNDLLKAETLCVEEQYRNGIQLARKVLHKKLNKQNKRVAWRIIGSCACGLKEIATVKRGLRSTDKNSRKVIIAACTKEKIAVSCSASSCVVE